MKDVKNRYCFHFIDQFCNNFEIWERSLPLRFQRRWHLSEIKQNLAYSTLANLSERQIGCHYNTRIDPKGGLRLMNGEQTRKDCQRVLKSLPVVS